MTRALLTFVAIVKDEAKSIRRTIESVRTHVDSWFVLDTGSTDGTQDIVRDAFGDLPGTLVEEPFVDFATTRNRALDLAHGRVPSVFTLMLSADEVLEGGEVLRAHLESKRDARDGAYCVQMVTETRAWPFARVLRSGGGWRYFGDLHEIPVAPTGEVRADVIPGVRVVFDESDPVRKNKRLREHDLPRLTARVEDETKSLEERAHAIFFLAETHAVLAQACAKTPCALVHPDCPACHGSGTRFAAGGPFLSHQMQAMALYFRYAEIANQPDRAAYDPDKVHYALFLHYHLADEAGIYNHRELYDRYQALVAVAPRMPEARYQLAHHASFLDLKLVVHLALEAARVAREVRESPTYQTTDVRIEWLSLRLAAAACKELKNEAGARDLAKRARQAGAPEALLEGIG